jgi:hypothetical protein
VSRQNKVNPDHYTMAGRLTPDDLARQRLRQGEQHVAGGRRGRNKAMPPWMANEGRHGGDEREDVNAGEEPVRDEERANDAGDDKGEDVGAGMPRRRAAQKRGAPASPKRKRPAPRRTITGDAVGTARKKSAKASGARGTPKTRKAPKARGIAARGSSPQRAARLGAKKGTTKGAGTTRQKQKKGGPSVSKKGAPTHRKR